MTPSITMTRRVFVFPQTNDDGTTTPGHAEEMDATAAAVMVANGLAAYIDAPDSASFDRLRATTDRRQPSKRWGRL